MTWISVATSPAPRWVSSAHDAVTLYVTWDASEGPLEFVATSSDTDVDGADLWTRAVAGEFGTIADPPDPPSGGDPPSIAEVMTQSLTSVAFGRDAAGNATGFAFGAVAQSIGAAATTAAARTALDLDGYKQSGANGGFGTSAGTNVKFRIRGAVDWTSGATYGVYLDPSPPDGASSYIGVYSIPVMGAAPAQAVITHFQAALPTVAASAIGNVFGFYATATLSSVGGSVNCGFRGALGAGSTNWNLYMDGAAPNYLAAALGLGTTTPTCLLDVRGPVRAGSYTRTTVPSASVVGAGAMIWVTNPASGVQRAFWSNGTDWRDGANVAP